MFYYTGKVVHEDRLGWEALTWAREMVSCRRLPCKLSVQAVRPGAMAREGSTSTLCVMRSSLHVTHHQQPTMVTPGSEMTNRDPGVSV